MASAKRKLRQAGRFIDTWHQDRTFTDLFICRKWDHISSHNFYFNDKENFTDHRKFGNLLRSYAYIQAEFQEISNFLFSKFLRENHKNDNQGGFLDFYEFYFRNQCRNQTDPTQATQNELFQNQELFESSFLVNREIRDAISKSLNYP